MYKDFAGWHARKAQLNALKTTQHFREREIWWTAVGHNIGSEEDGKGAEFARPVLVLRKFNPTFFLGLPLSTTKNTGPYYYPIKLQKLTTKILLSHIRDYDARRLLDKIDSIDTETFLEIQKQMSQVSFDQPKKVSPPGLRPGGSANAVCTHSLSLNSRTVKRQLSS